MELLANSFLQRFSREEGKTFDSLAAHFVDALSQHIWPGNVRELQNLMRRVSVMFEGPDVPMEALATVGLPVVHATPVLDMTAGLAQDRPSEVARIDRVALNTCLSGLTLDEIERIAIENAIMNAGGSLPTAARRLGVSPSTLYRKQEKWTVR